ncbi:MAG TPA: hypothetical protein DCL40_04920, partial [Coxiellaceae bacterium]|nr:hypothetical protein [Coxiellaceae bacterium]
QLSPQAENFWSVFETLLGVWKDPDWSNVAGFDAISIDVWFSADLLLVIWLTGITVSSVFKQVASPKKEGGVDINEESVTMMSHPSSDDGSLTEVSSDSLSSLRAALLNGEGSQPQNTHDDGSGLGSGDRAMTYP